MPGPLDYIDKILPGFSKMTGATTGNISNLLAGRLSPDITRNILDASATFGASSGMPRSGLARNIIPRDIGLTSQGLQQQGIQDLLSTLGSYAGTVFPTVGQTMQNNQFYAGLDERNREFNLTRLPEVTDYMNSILTSGNRRRTNMGYIPAGTSTFIPGALPG